MAKHVRLTPLVRQAKTRYSAAIGARLRGGGSDGLTREEARSRDTMAEMIRTRSIFGLGIA